MVAPRPLVQLPRAVQATCARLRFASLVVVLAIAAAPALLPDSAAAAPLMRVDDTRDLPDSNLGDGSCRAGFGADTGCTLRAAIQEANNSFGSDTILVGPGTYELEIPTFAHDLDSTGDFDIRASLTIAKALDGAGQPLAGEVVIDGGVPVESDPEAVGLDRLFEIHPSAGNVTFKDMTLREGYTDGEGAAIQDWSTGLLRLERMKVT
jgi:CSLREA domain-containing protein